MCVRARQHRADRRRAPGHASADPRRERPRDEVHALGARRRPRARHPERPRPRPWAPNTASATMSWTRGPAAPGAADAHRRARHSRLRGGAGRSAAPAQPSPSGTPTAPRRPVPGTLTGADRPHPGADRRRVRAARRRSGSSGPGCGPLALRAAGLMGAELASHQLSFDADGRQGPPRRRPPPETGRGPASGASAVRPAAGFPGGGTGLSWTSRKELSELFFTGRWLGTLRLTPRVI